MTTRSAAQSTITVTLHWGESCVAMRCLKEGEALSYGEGKGIWASLPWTREIPLGFTLARVTKDGGASAHVPPGSIVLLRRAEGQFRIVHGPAEVPLVPGDRLTIEASSFSLVIASDAPVALPKGRSTRRGALVPVAVAALAHALVMGLAAQASAARKLDETADDRIDVARELMINAEQRMRDNPPLTDGAGEGKGKKVADRDGDGRAAGGAAAKKAAGAMGDDGASRDKRGRYAVAQHHKGDRERANGSSDVVPDASSFGMIGLLAQGNNGSPVPSAWGKPEAHGADPLSVKGALWGDRSDLHHGSGGLGLTGIGEGGGGVGEGIGLNATGLIGHGAGIVGPGNNGVGSRPWVRPPKEWDRSAGVYSSRYGYGNPHDKWWRALSVLRRRIHACYLQGLARDFSLAGTIVVKIAVERGNVRASIKSASLPDERVVSCVVAAVNITFIPPPDHDDAEYVYPVRLSPSDRAPG